MREVWYPKNKAKHIALQKRRKVRLRNMIKNIKRYASCLDCGISGSRCPEVLEFDHVKGEKSTNIAWVAEKGYGAARLKAELAKCEIVCANCHRIRTVRRRGQL